VGAQDEQKPMNKCLFSRQAMCGDESWCVDLSDRLGPLHCLSCDGRTNMSPCVCLLLA
jgi:hypothetical protein